MSKEETGKKGKYNAQRDSTRPYDKGLNIAINNYLE
jgi:hypothetical protein